MIGLVPFPSTRFRATRQTAQRISLGLSLGGHIALSVFLISKALSPLLGLPEHESVALPPEEATTSAPAMTLVEIPDTTPNPHAPPEANQAISKARLRTGTEDALRKDPAELLNELSRLLESASKIDDATLDEIGVFLGKTPGQYQTRTYYKDELNRNANFATSNVVRAFAYNTPIGSRGYTITVEDTEKDRFTFTLEDTFAAPLTKANPHFDGKPLLPTSTSTSNSAFELKGATIRDIRRWKRDSDPIGIKGSLVDLAAPDGKIVTLPLDGKRYKPFRMERMRFMQKQNGIKDDGTTLHTQGFEYATATFLPPEKDDVIRKDGHIRLRQVLLDKNGERLIHFLEGDAAEAYLKKTSILQNAVVRNLYEQIGMQLLPGMLNDHQKEEKRNTRIQKDRAKKRNSQHPTKPTQPTGDTP